MRILWVINIMLPAYAAAKKLPYSEREGWLSGLYDAFLRNRPEGAELAVCFPSSRARKEYLDGVTWYGFRENLSHPEHYDHKLEARFTGIIEDYNPDITHIFGAEFPHALACARAMMQPERTLIGIQGICTEIAAQYRADLPDSVWNRSTVRDVLKKDSLIRQQEKMRIRGVRERGALLLAGHITGRTSFDREFVRKLVPRATYHFMNETLRPAFYGGSWSLKDAKPYSVFLAQGDYPLKGAHFVLRALPSLLRKFPQTHVTIAGNPVFDSYDAAGRLKGKEALKNRVPENIRTGAYGEYLRSLVERYGLREHVTLTGMLDAAQMRKRYLENRVFVCPSVLENSPNALGEAMLLGVPSAASRTGGIPSVMEDGSEGLLFTKADVHELAVTILKLFEDDALCERLSEAARKRAESLYNPETNAARLMEIYSEIAG